MHETTLRSPDFLEQRAGPSLLQRTDQRFMAAVLSELGDEGTGHGTLKSTLASDQQGGELRLYQPVHRVHHLAVLEASCLTPGMPRLDPAKIESAGLVLRRVVQTKQGELEQGYMRAGEKVVGWRTLAGDPAAQDASFADPDPERRRVPSLGQPELDRRVRALRKVSAPLTETTTAAFVAPPRVCERVSRTLLYGVVPLDSQQTVEEHEEIAFQASDVRERLPLHFQHGVRISVPRAGQRLDRDDARKPDLKPYLRFLQQLAVEHDLLGNTRGSDELRKALAPLRVSHGDDSWSLNSHLDRAIRVLVYGEGGSVRMPSSWPLISEAQEKAVLQAMTGVYRERFAIVKPQRGKLDDPEARYVVRAFVRVRRDDGCPPRLLWSAPSRKFRIAPWFDNGPLPPVTVQMPAITPAALKQLRPNVAFQVPAGLMNLLGRNEPEDFLEGNAEEKSGGTQLDWICGFNIPIITICAFILLSIILNLLNWIFWWLPFVRICIPIPASWRGGQ